MPPKSVKKTTPETVAPVTPVIETLQSTPVIEVAPTAPTVVKQKGGKKQKVVEPVVELAPVTPVATEPSLAPVVEQETQVKAPKKGGAKASKMHVTDASPAPILEGAPKTKKTKVQKAAVEGQPEEQVGGKPKASKKEVKARVSKKVAVAPSTSTTGETEAVEETSERLIRSFKVKLPDKGDFEGRFTGLTPYQAANKALSKYFRETENPKPEITFLICESTRKSKKSVYTYVGKRYQLEVPVKYTIQDGREIVKNFKNSLKKVKKVDLLEKSGGSVESEPVVATA
jgi:hypothetical protein